MADRGLIYGGVSGGSKYDGVLLQNQRLLSSSSSSFATKETLGSRFVNGCSPSFLASGSMVSFGDVNERNKRDRSFLHSFDQEENEADVLDEYFHQPEKKRRLTVDQVQFLEKCYEVENKLEPEKKVQLAKDLGLQPRQIAIWFQNRRARCKTKHLEKDYDALRNRYDNLKEDYDNLLKEKENLRAEALHLTDKLLLKEKEKGELASSDIQKLSHALPNETPADPVLQDEMSNVSATTFKQQEDSSSAKSDVFDSESPHYTDGVHSSFLDQCDSSYIFEPDQSDISQGEEENFSNSLLPSENLLAMAEHDHCYSMTSSNLSNFGFPVEDHGFGFWSF